MWFELPKMARKLTTLDGEHRKLTSDMTVISTPDRVLWRSRALWAALIPRLPRKRPIFCSKPLCSSLAARAARAATWACSARAPCATSAVLTTMASRRVRPPRRSSSRLPAAPLPALAKTAAASLMVARSPSEQPHLQFRVKRFQAMMGADIPRDFIVDTLERLGCEVAQTEDADVLSVISPTFRPDLPREIDLYEEVLRLYGMDNIPLRFLLVAAVLACARTRSSWTRKSIALFSACGINETMTYSFAAGDDLDKLRMKERRPGRGGRTHQSHEFGAGVHAPHCGSRLAAQRRA